MRFAVMLTLEDARDVFIALCALAFSEGECNPTGERLLALARRIEHGMDYLEAVEAERETPHEVHDLVHDEGEDGTQSVPI